LETGTPITSAPGQPRTNIVMANSTSREINQTMKPGRERREYSTWRICR
jgi:hypothetical protein